MTEMTEIKELLDTIAAKYAENQRIASDQNKHLTDRYAAVLLNTATLEVLRSLTSTNHSNLTKPNGEQNG